MGALEGVSIHSVVLFGWVYVVRGVLGRGKKWRRQAGRQAGRQAAGGGVAYVWRTCELSLGAGGTRALSPSLALEWVQASRVCAGHLSCHHACLSGRGKSKAGGCRGDGDEQERQGARAPLSRSRTGGIFRCAWWLSSLGAFRGRLSPLSPNGKESQIHPSSDQPAPKKINREDRPTGRPADRPLGGEEGKQKQKCRPSSLGIPTWSPTVVLTKPNAA